MAGDRPRPIGTPYRVRLDIYLVSYGREEEEGEEAEKERERQRGGKRRSREKGEIEAASSASSRGRQKEKDSGWKMKISLPQQTGEEVGVACLLKGQSRPLQTPLLPEVSLTQHAYSLHPQGHSKRSLALAPT